ncbi:MAG: DNA polymerase III subunit delta' [Herpetosiphonaceae bacterium]|nr:MAG: DNA polymerase III subunit delta' [Herpetosiphonaceae bacterium]
MGSWNIIGHEWAIDLLQRSIAAGRPAHAYLMSGPPGVGKTTLALRLAQALNCDTGAASPCGSCRTCRRIERGNHPDVRRAGLDTQAAGKKAEEAARQKALSIDTIRAFQGDIALRPYEGRRRVFILHDAETLSDQAANALLKTLEEPPPFATLVLVAQGGGELLPTVVSRCQVLKLRPLPRATVAAALQERYNLSSEDAAVLAAWSGGRIGWAFEMAESQELLQQRRDQIDELLALQQQPLIDRLRWAEERSKEYRAGQQTTVFRWLDLWSGWWRDAILVAAGCSNDIVNLDRLADLQAIAAPLPARHAFLRRIDQAAQQLRENVNPQLVLESLVLHLPD